MRKLVLVLTLIVLAGCGTLLSETPVPTVDTSTPNHDVQPLQNIITLDAPPQQVSWIQYALGDPSRAPGPTDYALVAILEYDTLPDFSQLVEQTGRVTVGANFVETWFPPAVQAVFVDDPNGDGLLVNATTYEPTPYTPMSGYMFVVENMVFISVHTT